MTTDTTRGHIDAETLAAWADHSLPANAAASVELHLSNCDRCQEVLAAFVRSEPAAGAVIIPFGSRPFWSRRPIQWSAAGLAAAAAIVAMIYIGRPPTTPVAEPVTSVAQAPIDALRPAVPPPAPADTQATTPTPPARSADERSVRQEKSTIGAAEARADKKITAPKPAAEAVAQSQPSLQSRAAPPPPPPVPTMAQGVAAATPPPPPAVSVSELALKDASSVFEVVAPDFSLAMTRRANDRSGIGGGAGGGGGRGGAGVSTGLARWRVTNGTRIERSTDSGKTWVAMELQPALTTRLTAGAATSQLVCWFVGTDGVVLLTTDGRTLRRVSIPEASVLVSVTAEDSLRATVTTADGRKLTTVDGGLTWKSSEGNWLDPANSPSSSF